ncbi:putative disease resistance protein RGA3 [Morella rubra]|uniref:Putative disease resistance protein RGA3 n=1 Tax=Morella rubra TaxID=262757 RepID=A0A6A1WQT8_9ROSI|nr:putative disease resistance protein RGA3 [Morella rubra]
MAIAALMLCFAEGIATQLGSLSAKHLGPFFCVKDDLQALEDKVKMVNAVLLDAEEQQARSHAITLWLENLTDAFYDADDLLDDLSTEVQLREANEVCVYLFFSKLADCVEMGPQIQPLLRHANKVCASVCLFFPKLADGVVDSVVMSPKIKALRKRFDAIADDRKKFHFKEHPVDTRVRNRERDTYSFVPQEQVIGREDDKKAVIELLMESNIEENVSILAIVGIGGLGKTTLAQLLFNDEKVKKHFELKMWVCVSDNFDVGEIVKKMIESETNQKPGDIGELIGGKKYFLVLDDVWNEDIKKWDDLEKLLLCGARGSRVLVTTRSETVAKISCSGEPYILKGLEKPESWSLFKHMAFRNGEEPESPTIIEIGNEILKECQGVPLVIRTIGRLLRSRHLEKEWHLEIEGCWSLKYMPRGLGQLTNLMTLSWFVVNSGGGVSGNSGGLDELKGLNSLRGKLEIRGLVHGKEVASEYKAANLKDKQHLHTLVLEWIDIGENVVDDDTQLEGLEPHPNLKMLSLENYGGVRFPNWLLLLTNLVSMSLDCCKNLTYLPSLSQLTSLNSLTLMELHDLEYILDSNMIETEDASWKPLQQTMMTNVAALESRSAEIVSPALVASSPTPLSKLKSLKLRDVEDLRSLPEEGLRNLISLKDLSIDSCKDDDWMQGQGLKSLRTLNIYGLPKLVSLPEEGLRNLTSLQDLSIYSLRYCDELDLGKDDDWMQGQGLKSLRTLNIYGLPKLVSLPEEGLRNLTSLQDLSINSCKDDDWMQGQGLKSLHTLRILPKLVSLPSGLQHLTILRAFEISSCVSLTAIPDWIHKWTSLEEFTIRSCTRLTSLPEGMRRLTSLRNLTIIDCPILLQRCEKDKGKDWPKIAHIPDLKFISVYVRHIQVQQLFSRFVDSFLKGFQDHVDNVKAICLFCIGLVWILRNARNSNVHLFEVTNWLCSFLLGTPI